MLNYWQDEQHPRGMWRVSPLAAFAAGQPQWRTLLDIDAMSKADNKKWVFKGATCLSPAYVDCMVSLSNGGGDAVEVREFDLDKAAFIPGGFFLPTAKSDVSWAGPDALFVGTDFGPGTLTDSGYRADRQAVAARHAARGGDEARRRREERRFGQRDHAASTATRTWPIVTRAIDFYHHKVSHIAPDGRLIPSPLPDDADIDDVLDGRVIASLKTPWQGHPAGALVAYSIPDLLAGKPPAIETVFVPNEHQAVEEVSASQSKLWVKYLEDVSGRLTALTRAPDGTWSGTPVALPDKSTIHLNATASTPDLAFATVEGMLTPPTLFRVEPAARRRRAIQALPPQFDASEHGRRAAFRDLARRHQNPLLPRPSKGRDRPGPGADARLWRVRARADAELSRPRALSLRPARASSGCRRAMPMSSPTSAAAANMGPRWHNAVLRENRQKAYDDLYAVAQDLIARGITQKGRLAVSGRSNGGLMAAVAITERPDLWGGAIIGSPLVDMKRYSHLLAGASWMGEYGNPDVPADWAFISKYSPYQNLKCGVKYPVPFIYTSTRDDRVHPGHARKLAARLEELRRPVLLRRGDRRRPRRRHRSRRGCAASRARSGLSELGAAAAKRPAPAAANAASDASNSLPGVSASTSAIVCSSDARHQVARLEGVVLVGRVDGPLDREGQPLDCVALQAEVRLRRSSTRGPAPRILSSPCSLASAELDAVPVEARGALPLAGGDRRAAKLADMPRHFGKIVMREHRDVPEQIVEAVRRLEIIELVARADEIADREHPLAQHREEDVVGHEPGHRDRAPAGPRLQDRVQLRRGRGRPDATASAGRSRRGTAETTREPSSSTCRANSRSHTAWSSAVNASQHCGTT